MILTKEALMTMVHDKFKDSEDEEDITFIENISDTVTDLYSKADSEPYKQKYLDLQQRYKERFFGGGTESEEETFEEETKDYNKLSYDDLFTKK